MCIDPVRQHFVRNILQFLDLRGDAFVAPLVGVAGGLMEVVVLKYIGPVGFRESCQGFEGSVDHFIGLLKGYVDEVIGDFHQYVGQLICGGGGIGHGFML